MIALLCAAFVELTTNFDKFLSALVYFHELIVMKYLHYI